jgi:hypothetical protein
MSLLRDYLRLLIVVDFVMMKSTGGFPARRVFRHAGFSGTQGGTLLLLIRQRLTRVLGSVRNVHYNPKSYIECESNCHSRFPPIKISVRALRKQTYLLLCMFESFSQLLV